MRFDLIVVGGGVVGASVVRAARGLSVALVSGARPVERAAAAEAFDTRVYALSPGSVEFLRELKVWDRLPRERLTPVHAMRVHGDAPDAALEMDAYRVGVPELAWIVEDSALQSALWGSMDSQDRLEVFSPSECESIELRDTARVRLADGRILEADLLVGADGADSKVRSGAGIRVREKDYGQTALVANFSCRRNHENTASQWFRDGAVLALLPLPGNKLSMVWSLPDAEAVRLQALDPQALAFDAGAASGGWAGPLELISPVRSFPLRRLQAERMVLPHLALAGDAAHVIHPLAGQGLNLGLQDARVLGAAVANREPVRTPGDYTLLRRYERERRESILAMGTAVHGLQLLFGSGRSSLGRLRNLGLNLTDRLPVLKNALIRHALH